jgi:hypothetical protein
MKPRTNGREDFLMTHRPELEAVIDALRTRRLQLRDLATVMALMANTNWRSGRIRITATYLAQQMGVRLDDCVSSLSRLKKEMVAVRIREPKTGDTYFVLNPDVISVGSEERRQLLRRQFQEAYE